MTPIFDGSPLFLFKKYQNFIVTQKCINFGISHKNSTSKITILPKVTRQNLLHCKDNENRFMMRFGIPNVEFNNWEEIFCLLLNLKVQPKNYWWMIWQGRVQVLLHIFIPHLVAHREGIHLVRRLLHLLITEIANLPLRKIQFHLR